MFLATKAEASISRAVRYRLRFDMKSSGDRRRCYAKASLPLPKAKT